jgi:penicillin-binding protein 2
VGTWQIGDQANFNIGQGTVLSTPLQLATAYAALANGGTLYQPTIGWGVLGPDGKVVQTIKPAVRSHLTVNPATLAGIRSAMCQVPTIGTAASAFVGFDFSKVTVCGKTGTAQTTSAHDSTSWFTSFGGPVNDPNRYVVTVVVPDGGYGAAAAGPAVRRIYDGMFGLNGKTPIQLATSLPTFRSDGTVVHPVPLSRPNPTPSGPATSGPATSGPATSGPATARATPTVSAPASNGTTSGAAVLLASPPVSVWLLRRRRRARRHT